MGGRGRALKQGPIRLVWPLVDLEGLKNQSPGELGVSRMEGRAGADHQAQKPEAAPVWGLRPAGQMATGGWLGVRTLREASTGPGPAWAPVPTRSPPGRRTAAGRSLGWGRREQGRATQGFGCRGCPRRGRSHLRGNQSG